MTDEERKKLCDELRVADYYRTDGTARKTRHDAADEIERLAKRVSELENRGSDNRPLTAAAAFDASKIKTHTI
jgi:hypothetical protein